MIEFVTMEYFNKKVLSKIKEYKQNAIVVNYSNGFGGSFYKAYACDNYKDMLQAKNNFLDMFNNYEPKNIQQAMCKFKIIDITYYYSSGKKYIEKF